jgi:GntR family transcriptional regulator
MRSTQRLPSGQREHAARRLRNILRSEVNWGTYQGGLLPSESELMVRYGLSRGAVREALAMLRDEGAIHRQQGTGTFVVAQASAMPLSEAHGVFRPDHSMFDSHSTLELDRSVVPAPDAVARRLETEPGEPCLRLEYLATSDGQPFAVATNFVLMPEGTAIGDIPLERSWYELMARAGLAVEESEFVFGCVNADKHTAALLGSQPGAAMLTLEQVIRDADGRAFNFAFVSTRGDRAFFSSRARRGALDEYYA